MRYLIVSLIAVVAGYVGYRAGRESVLRQIRKASAKMIGELATALERMRIAQPEPPSPPAPKSKPTDTADPHNISQDLADGKIAMYYPKDGNC